MPDNSLTQQRLVRLCCTWLHQGFILATQVMFSVLHILNPAPRLPCIRLDSPRFVMTACCPSTVKVQEHFLVRYTLLNNLQDFLAVRLVWTPEGEEPLGIIVNVIVLVQCRYFVCYFCPKTYTLSPLWVKVSMSYIKVDGVKYEPLLLSGA